MTGAEIFDAVIKVLQVVIIPVVGLFAKWIHAAITSVDVKITNVHGEMVKLNGRMIKQEEWASGHEKLDDGRHAEVLQVLRARDGHGM